MIKQLRKKALSLALALAMCLSLLPAAVLAADDTQTLEAKALFELGLFSGYDTTGTNFGLTDSATREQAIVLLLNLLGEGEAAKKWTGSSPFTDVPENHWSKPYLGYAKEKNYTAGTGDGKFGLGETATQQQMVTFALRGLKYSIENGDFTYDKCLDKGKELGILDSNKEVSKFRRGNVVDIMFNSLAVNVKGQQYDLLSKLLSEGVVTQSQVDKATAVVSSSQTGSTVKVTGVSISGQSVNPIWLDVGKTKKFTATVSPSNATDKSVTWSSSNPSVAKVSSDGTVTALKAGSTVIEARSVSNTNKFGRVRIKVSGTAQSTGTITAAFVIDNQTGKDLKEIYFEESSSNNWGDEVLQTFGYGNGHSSGYYITLPIAFQAGASIDFRLVFKDGTVKEAYGLSLSKATGHGGRINLTSTKVNLVLSGSTVAASATLTTPGTSVTGVSLNKSTASVAVGSTVQLTATVSPSSATNKAVTWSSSKTSVATVTSAGVVKGVKAGTATITVKTSDGGKTATCTVTVTAADTAAVSDADWKTLQSNYETLKTNYNAVANAYNAGKIQDDSKNSVKSAIDEAYKLINEIGEIKRDGMTAADAKTLNSAMSDLNDVFIDVIDYATPVSNADWNTLQSNYDTLKKDYDAVAAAYSSDQIKADADINKGMVAAAEIISEMGNIDRSAVTAGDAKDLNDAMIETQKLLTAIIAKMETATRTINVTFKNGTDAVFKDFTVTPKGGQSSGKQDLADGATVTLQFTVASQDAVFTVSFTENNTQTKYTWDIKFASSVKSGDTVRILLDAEDNAVVYDIVDSF